MQFYRERKKRKKPLVVIVVLCVIIFAGVFFVFDGVPKILSVPLFSVASPLWRSGTVSEGIGGRFLDLLKSKQRLIRENYIVSDEMARLRGLVAGQDSLMEENKALNKALGRSDFWQKGMVFARVMRKPGALPYDTLIIDIGRDEAIAVGDLVLSGAYAIGHVAEVYGGSAKVQLFSSWGEEINVLIGEQSLAVIAQGFGGGMFGAILPRDTTLAIGDNVYVADAPDVPFAKIAAMRAHVTDPYHIVMFRSDVNIAELAWVGVLRGGSE